MQSSECQEAPEPAHQELGTRTVERYEEDLRPFVLLFAHVLFKSQPFQQRQQNPLMPTCQLLPCMNLEKPSSQLSLFHPTPAGRCMMENPAVDKPAHGLVQVHGVLLPMCPSSRAQEASTAGHAWHPPYISSSYCILAWPLFPNISESEVSSSDEWLIAAGHIITSSKFFSLRAPKQRFDNDILCICRDSSRLNPPLSCQSFGYCL